MSRYTSPPPHDDALAVKAHRPSSGYQFVALTAYFMVERIETSQTDRDSAMSSDETFLVGVMN